MENWQVALLVLVALLVGAAIPALLQLRVTLSELSKITKEASHVVDGLQSTTRVMGAIGAAIGPAVLAGLSSYRASREASEKEENHEQRSRVGEQA